MRILASPAFNNELVNPYNALLYREISALGPEVIEYTHKKIWQNDILIVHFHWPDGYINQKGIFKSLQRIVILSLSILIAKIKGSKIVWTVHNLEPHDAFHPFLAKRFMRWFVNRCDGFIFLSEESKKSFINKYPTPTQIKYSIIPHGHYRNSYASRIDKTEAKNVLNIAQSQNVLLCIGMIKPYKNVDHLIQLFNDIKQENWTLVIAGKPDSIELEMLLTKLAVDNPNIRLIFKFIANHEIADYLTAADVVILPYKNILNSGALLLALSFDKPVIAPLAGAVINLHADLGNEWICGYSEELTAIKLNHFLNYFSGLTPSTHCPLENYNWDSIGKRTLAFYNKLMVPAALEDQLICR